MTDDRPLVDADFVDMEDLETAPYTKAQARRVTEQIKLDLIGVWHLIADAYKGRIWIPLGYSNWDEYCGTEFGCSRLRLPREERPEMVASLRESGLSLRAIAAATGDHYSTISRELGRVANATREPTEDDADESPQNRSGTCQLRRRTGCIAHERARYGSVNVSDDDMIARGERWDPLRHAPA